MQACRSAPQIETDDIDGLGQSVYPVRPASILWLKGTLIQG